MRIKHEYYVGDYVFYVKDEEVTGGIVSKLITSNPEQVSYIINGQIFKEKEICATRAQADDKLIEMLQAKADKLTQRLLSSQTSQASSSLYSKSIICHKNTIQEVSL